MSKQIVHEQDLAAFAASHTPAGESTLVGVYAAKRIAVPFFKTLAQSVIIGAWYAGGYGAAKSNLWCELFANDKRIVVAELHYTNAEIGQVATYQRGDISSVKVKRRLLTYAVYVKLKDDSKYKYVIGRFVAGHPTHKQRLHQLLEILARYPVAL